jgi:hypothetical protein
MAVTMLHSEIHGNYFKSSGRNKMKIIKIRFGKQGKVIIRFWETWWNTKPSSEENKKANLN